MWIGPNFTIINDKTAISLAVIGQLKYTGKYVNQYPEQLLPGLLNNTQFLL